MINTENEKMDVEITPRTDIIFRNIFGKEGNEAILEDFLEGIMGEKVKVKKLQSNEELSVENIYQKRAIVDIKTELEDNRIIDIEMQNEEHYYYNKRVLYYLGKIITGQVKSGERYADIKEVIIINILNYKLPDIPEYMTKCRITNESNYYMKEATIYYIQLPRFLEERKLLDPNRKYEDIIKSKLDEWCVFLCDENKGVRNMAVKTNLSLEEAVKQYEELSARPEVVEIAFRRQMAESDRKSNEEYMRQAGIEEGKIAGRAEGIAEGRIEGMIKSKAEIAKKMLEQKINIQLIIQITGLTKEELEELKEN